MIIQNKFPTCPDGGFGIHLLKRPMRIIKIYLHNRENNKPIFHTKCLKTVYQIRHSVSIEF